jgi:hypothetical protein
MTAATLTKLIVADYRENYGGVPVLIEGNECSLGSVVGYALYNREVPVQAVLDTLERMKTQPYNGHKLVWINRHGTCISGDPGHYERQEALRAAMPRLSVGDTVEFEGKRYEIKNAPNRNYDLVPVAA